MYLVHILLPLNDNDGRPHGRELFRTVSAELTQRFGGLTAHTRAPAEGLWEDDGEAERDEIVIYEVMAEDLDAGWWSEYRESLEARFRQKRVVVRSQEIRLL